ncbi:MAG: TolC family protein, partial [Archangium sp.]|nr:TolC family protein [Archangium sp.]
MNALVLLLVAATPLSLDEVRAASRANLQAIQSELSLQSAQAGRVSARSSILPRVDVSAGVSDFIAGPQRTFSTVPSLDENGQPAFVQRAVDVPGFSRGSFTFGVSVSQLLYDGGRWWRAIAQAASQEEAARGQLDEQRLASELEAVRRFYELVRAQLTRQVLQATLQRSRTQLERAQ